jgi:lactate dehydrogenase-like 2-hydroxyacid dehydrogenase
LVYVEECIENISTNVDIETAKELGITVKGVRDYGDEGTIEFIISQLISLFKGIGKAQWRSESTELTGKSLGIIGLGTLDKWLLKQLSFLA